MGVLKMTEGEVENFDLTAKKKKKKKKTPFDLDGAEPVENEDGPAEEEAPKKEKKKVEFEEENSENVDDIDLESFGTKKKKKKKRDENKAEEEDMDLDLDSFGTKKKKKKKKKADLDDLDNEEDKENEGDDPNTDPWKDSDRDYQYDELLQRVFGIMRDKNPEMVAGEKKKFVMRPPQVARVGSKKTAFANFTEIAKMLHRQPKHLLAFLFAELGTSGAIDGSNQLIMKGRFQQKHIENVLRRYIKEYVTCHTCRSPDTILNKETRLFFLQCMTCHSSCSVQTIKTGFQAVTGKRSAIRAKQ